MFETTLDGPPDKMIPVGENDLKKLMFIFWKAFISQ